MTETRAVLTARSAGVEDDAANALRVPQLFSDLPDAVIVANSAREITWVNPTFERIFGYQSEEVLGRTTKFLYASHDSYVEKGPSTSAQPRPRKSTVMRSAISRKTARRF